MAEAQIVDSSLTVIGDCSTPYFSPSWDDFSPTSFSWYNAGLPENKFYIDMRDAKILDVIIDCNESSLTFDVELRRPDFIELDVRMYSDNFSVDEEKTDSIIKPMLVTIDNQEIEITKSYYKTDGESSVSFPIVTTISNTAKYMTVKILDLKLINSLSETQTLSESISETENTPIITNEPIPSSQEDTTLLIYMVASNLETDANAATNDLKEMMDASHYNPNLNVIIQTGGANAKPDDSRTVDFTTNNRFKLAGTELILVENIGKKNMASSSTLSDFLIWGIDNYPSDRYHVILWDHGSGIDGFGNDELYDMDNLNLDELYDAFETTKKAHDNVTFDIIGFDACLMATIEIASTLQYFGNYLVASEEVEPGEGWDYTAILSSLNEDHEQNGQKLGKVIVDSYLEHYKNLYGAPSELETLSVVNLSKINSIENNLDSLFVKLDTYLTGENSHLFLKAVTTAENYGIYASGYQSGQTDLIHISQNIGKEFPEIKSFTDSVIQSVDDAVMYSKNFPTKPNANGLAMFVFPNFVSDYSPSAGGRAFEQQYQDFVVTDVTPPTIDAEVVGLDLVGSFDETDVSSLSMIISSSGNLYSNEPITYFGNIEFNPYDYTDGEFTITWNGEMPWLCLTDFDLNAEIIYAGMCFHTFPEYVFDDEITLAYIPILIASDSLGNPPPEICTILVDGESNRDYEPECDSENIDDLLFGSLVVDITDVPARILGVWVDEPGDSIYSRNIYQIQNGDVIWTVLKEEDPNSDLLVDLTSSPILVSDDLSFDFDSLDSTPFWSTLRACDYNGNCSFDGPYQYIVDSPSRSVVAVTDVQKCENELKEKTEPISMKNLVDPSWGFSIDFPECWNYDNDAYYGDTTQIASFSSGSGFDDAHFSIHIMESRGFDELVVAREYLDKIMEKQKIRCEQSTSNYIFNGDYGCDNFEVYHVKNLEDWYSFGYTYSSNESLFSHVIVEMPDGDMTWQLNFHTLEEDLDLYMDTIDQMSGSFETTGLLINPDFYTNEYRFHDGSLSTFSNQDFSIKYPSNWYVNDDTIDFGDSLGIVWFTPDLENYMPDIAVFNWHDRDWSEMSKNSILNELRQESLEWCKGYNLNDDGFICRNQNIIDADSHVLNDGKKIYFIEYEYDQVAIDEIESLVVRSNFVPNGSEVWEIYIITEVGDETITEDVPTIVSSFSLTAPIISTPSPTPKNLVNPDGSTTCDGISGNDCGDEINSGGGCLIATATFDSELAPQVQMLREIRDNSLLSTQSGTNFMSLFNEFYYSFSPIIADYERENPVFKEMVKLAITPMITSLSILNYVDMDSEESVLGYGISLILLNVGMYFVSPVIVLYKFRKNLGGCLHGNF